LDLNTEEIAGSALAGILGTLAFGGSFTAIGNTGTVSVAIPALYGISGPNLIAGWAIHLFHGAVLGTVYALIVSGTGYGHHLEDVSRAALLGAGYGALTAVLLAGLLMPVWLASAGFQNAPSVPNFSPTGMVGHVIYGGVTGASYPVLRARLAE
jgi:hypothetical protein